MQGSEELGRVFIVSAEWNSLSRGVALLLLFLIIILLSYL